MTEYIAIVQNESGVFLNDALGTTTVEIESVEPRTMLLPGLGERQFFMLRLDKLTTAQRLALTLKVAAGFRSTEAEARKQLARWGFPIAAEDCTVQVFEPPQVERP